MAEFCLDCWNKLNNTKHTADMYIIDKTPDLCEGCGEYKPTVIKRKGPGFFERLFRRMK